MGEDLYISDSIEAPTFNRGKIISWSGDQLENSLFSIADYLEENSDRLRSKYLKFIYELGNSKFKRKSIIEHLAIENDFSFWWMTLLAEKSPFKSERINDCLKILALEEIAQSYKIQTIIFKSSDKELAEAIKILSESMCIGFTWIKEKPIRIWSLRNLYHRLPQSIQGLISIRHFFLRWKLRDVGNINWFGGDDTFFIGSYFFNIDKNSLDRNFHSNQWGALTGSLIEHGKKINWLHHYLPSPDIQSPKEAALMMRGFNSKANLQELHKFVESFLSAAILCKTLKRWVWLNLVLWRLRLVKGNFKVGNSHVCLWPLLKKDWQNSIVGPYAINSLLWIDLFDSALKEIPHQKIGIFLWENQGWETALIKAWKKYSHGKIIGVPHATICFWHLNNFEDPQIYQDGQDKKKPTPNFLAVNGPMAWNNLSEGGVPTSRMRPVEALRFSYLDEIRRERDRGVGRGLRNVGVAGIKLLVIGDFTVCQTHKMLKCVEGVSKILGQKILVTLKPHPVCLAEGLSDVLLDFDINLSPLKELLKDFDIAFVSGTSSAALDALLSGLAVCVFRDDAELNHSPLRGVKGVDFAGNSSELAQFLLSQAGGENAFVPDEFFWINDKLPLWNALLLELDNKIRPTL